MNISIEIADDKVRFFSEDAKQELNLESKKMIENLIDEACRFEGARRDSTTKQEVTQADVKDAAKYSKRKIQHKKKWVIICKGLCPLLMAIPGFVFNINNVYFVIIAFIILFIALIINVFLISEDLHNG